MIRKIGSSAVVVLLLVMFSIAVATKTLGGTVPTMNLRTLKGGLVNLAGFTGSVVVISFFHQNCKPCIKEIPFLERLKQKHKKVTLVLVASRTCNAEHARVFLKKIKRWSGVEITAIVVLDRFGDAAEAFSVKAFPATFVANTRGKVLLRLEGYNSKNGETIANMVAKLAQ